jgi:hypothetical protein
MQGILMSFGLILVLESIVAILTRILLFGLVSSIVNVRQIPAIVTVARRLEEKLDIPQVILCVELLWFLGATIADIQPSDFRSARLSIEGCVQRDFSS